MNCSPQLLSCPASTSSEEERVEKRKGYKGERAKKPKKHFVVFSWHEQINDLHFTAGDTIQSIKVKSWGTSSHRHRTHTHTQTATHCIHTLTQRGKNNMANVKYASFLQEKPKWQTACGERDAVENI